MQITPFRNALRTGALLLLSCAVLTARADDPDAKITTLDQWDDATEYLRRSAWTSQLAGSGSELPRDARGRTVADDMQRWSLDEATLAHLASLRAAAREASLAGQDPAAERALQEAAPILERALLDALLVHAYWSTWELVEHHRLLIERWLPRAPLVAAASIRGAIADAGSKAMGLLPADSDDRAARANRLATYQLLNVAIAKQLNEARGVLLDALDELQAAHSEPPLARDRESPCTPPATQVSGSGRPKITKASFDIGALYPPQQKRMQVEATVRIAARISADGCMLHAEVDKTSGSDELDAASLVAAEYLEFAPAQADGKAVESQTKFNIRFRLYD